jgi:phosphoglycerate kinase
MATSDQPSRQHLKTMDDLPLDGKHVLVRVDLNVSVGADGRVDESEDYRIEAALPTIEELMQRRCKVILVTHRGDPQKKPEDRDLAPIHRRLQELLKEEVKLTRSLFGNDVGAIVDGMEPGGVALLPNVRSDAREEMGKPAVR